MFSKSIQIVKKSIFPIFYFTHNSSGVLGTGFFIDEEGHFMTANHVIDALPKNSRLSYLGNIPNCNFKGKKPIPISVIFQDANKDLAIGKVEAEQLTPLKFARTNAMIGQSISLCGYPVPMIIKKGSSLDVSSVRQYWQPTIKMDIINKKFLYNKPFKSFITQHACLPGMSGGPIFNINGEVVGVASANWTRQIKRGNIPINIENGVGVDLSEINTFLNSTLNKKEAILA